MCLVPSVEIAELTEEIDGELIDRSKVIDHLLDLRSVSPGLTFTAQVDRLLSDVPGKSVVDAAWWRQALAQLAESTEPQPA